MIHILHLALRRYGLGFNVPHSYRQQSHCKDTWGSRKPWGARGREGLHLTKLAHSSRSQHRSRSSRKCLSLKLLRLSQHSTLTRLTVSFTLLWFNTTQSFLRWRNTVCNSNLYRRHLGNMAGKCTFVFSPTLLLLLHFPQFSLAGIVSKMETKHMLQRHTASLLLLVLLSNRKLKVLF